MNLKRGEKLGYYENNNNSSMKLYHDEKVNLLMLL
jgi:hypothetical protein